MKNILLITIIALALSSFSQNIEKSAKTTTTQKSFGLAEFSFVGETTCCYDGNFPNNIYPYNIEVSIDDDDILKWEFEITDGEIVSVDGVSIEATNTWSTNTNLKDNYDLGIIWDNEDGYGNISATLRFMSGVIQFIESGNYRTTIGIPFPITNINFSNTNPYPNESLICSASSSEGSDVYRWTTNNGIIKYQGKMPVKHIPNTIGESQITVNGFNLCGNGPSYTESITVSPPSLNVNITGPIWGNESTVYTWVGSASGGTSPYTYDWYKSYDGNNYTAWYMDTNPLTVQMPQNYDLYLKLIATDANGWVGTAYHVTENTGSGGGHGSPKSATIDGNQIEVSKFDVYPNPTTGMIKTPLNYQEDYSILMIYNMSGKMIQEFSIIEENIDLSSIENGVYLFKFINNANGDFKNIKIIKE